MIFLFFMDLIEIYLIYYINTKKSREIGQNNEYLINYKNNNNFLLFTLILFIFNLGILGLIFLIYYLLYFINSKDLSKIDIYLINNLLSILIIKKSYII